jgi:putative endonuclease
LFATYILKSQLTGRFYTGSAENPETRLRQHNSGKNSSTRHGIPWAIVYVDTFATRREALALERRIKARGAKRFLDDLYDSTD